jgi:riboflavin biosynthesis pyrimidine reductase
VATVSRRLDERLARVPLLAEPRTRIQLYTESEAAAPAPGAQIETERFAPGTLSLAAALGHLRRERGVRLLVAEGGPTLLRRLLADGLVDELILTLAPLLVAGDGPGVVDGPALDPPARMRLAEVLRAEDHLFLRYVLPA